MTVSSLTRSMGGTRGQRGEVTACLQLRFQTFALAAANANETCLLVKRHFNWQQNKPSSRLHFSLDLVVGGNTMSYWQEKIHFMTFQSVTASTVHTE